MCTLKLEMLLNKYNDIMLLSKRQLVTKDEAYRFIVNAFNKGMNELNIANLLGVTQDGKVVTFRTLMNTIEAEAQVASASFFIYKSNTNDSSIKSSNRFIGMGRRGLYANTGNQCSYA